MKSCPQLSGAAHWITKRIVSPFLMRRAWLRRTQWLSPEELLSVQLRLTRRLLRHCFQTVPYYRALMHRHGITPDIKSLDEINKLPILTKREVLDAGTSIQSTKYPRWMNSVGLTGGTTGTPLRVRRNWMSIGTEHAFVRRQFEWAGLSLNDRTAYLTGRQVVSPDQRTGQLYAYDPFMRELILSNYHLSRDNVEQFVEAIRKYHISALSGYAFSIYSFAQLCEELGYEISFKAVLTTSEMNDDHMKAVIRKVFSCDVYDYYGSAERVCYIFTCEKGKYHVLPEYGLTEFQTQSGHLEGTHRIIATGFWNRATPLLRYDTGDACELASEECSCGRHFQVVKRLIGRTGTFIETPSGKKYAPTLMARVAKMANNIMQTQIVQDRIDHVYINYIPNAQFNDDDLAEFKTNVLSYLPTELDIDFKKTDQMIKTASGKTNLIVSKL